MAAALDADAVEQVTAGLAEASADVGWDERRGDLRVTATRRVGGLVLAETEGPAPIGPATTARLIEQVRATRLGILRWTDRARALQARALFLRSTFGETWPDVSDAALLASLDDWLAPRLAAATSRADLEAIDLAKVLRTLVGPARRAQLDSLAPPALTTAAGRTLAVDYRAEQPVVRAKVQELFGTTEHPTVAGGRVPVLVHLLSPAGRPVQVTADLPGFWAGSYASVRKDMAGRYPKHAWPRDPATVPAAPAAGRPRPRKRRR
jgi:ATP-dependent helicase HrpB